MNKTEFCLRLFQKDIRKYKRFTSEDSIRAILKYRKTLNEKYLNPLILGNLRFVIHRAKRYRTTSLSASDLIYSGIVGLTKAAKKFDETKKIKFLTYATYWITMYMRREIIYNSSIVKMSPSSWDLSIKAKRLMDQGILGKDLLKALKIRKRTLSSLRKINSDFSLNTIASEEDESTVGKEYGDIIVSEKDTPSTIYANDDMMEYVNSIVNVLKDRELDIVAHKFGLFGYKPVSLKEMSKKYRISPERTRQILGSGLDKIKKKISDDDR